MDWELKEALDYYGRQGAPANQTVLIALLKEIQQESGGALPRASIQTAAEHYGVQESLLLAVVRRIPSLRLENTHCLEICGGKNCGRRLADFVEKTYGPSPKGFTVKVVPCLRQCGRGPNLRWDGTLYNGADEQLIRSLIEKSK